MNDNLVIFSGSSYQQFAMGVARYLNMNQLGRLHLQKFSNENMFVKIKDNVRGKDAFVIQTQFAPLSDNLMEMFLIIRALKQSSAARVTAVFPYFPYARSDKQDQPRICIAARLMADLVEAAGADRVLTMDLHSPQVQGFFSVPVDQLLARPVFLNYLTKMKMETSVAVAADAGEAKHIGPYAERLRIPMAIVDKRRTGHDEKAAPANLIGDVEGKNALIFDDEICSGGTFFEAANFLVKKHGAIDVLGCITHPVLTKTAPRRLEETVSVVELAVTDTIPVAEDKKSAKLKQLTVVPLFAKAIEGIHNDLSLSTLFSLESYHDQIGDKVQCV